MMRRERGFLMLEAALLGVFLALMALMFPLPRQAAALRQASTARQTAVHLAQQELVELAAAARQSSPQEPVHTGWLGPDEDLSRHVRAYEVMGEIVPDAAGWQLRSSVSWEMHGAVVSLTLEKWVGAHGEGK